VFEESCMQKYVLNEVIWISYSLDNLIGLCWVFVLAALLLKQISMFVLLDSMFQHVLGISVRCWI